MISISAIMARVKRKKIPEMAGEHFLSGAEIKRRIEYLRGISGEQFLFGIYESPDKWTVLSVGKLFASYESEPFQFILNTESYKIHDYYGSKGNKYSIDVVLEGDRRIWMKSVELSSGIQNIVLMLQKLPSGTVLQD